MESNPRAEIGVQYGLCSFIALWINVEFLNGWILMMVMRKVDSRVECRLLKSNEKNWTIPGLVELEGDVVGRREKTVEVLQRSIA